MFQTHVPVSLTTTLPCKEKLFMMNFDSRHGKSENGRKFVTEKNQFLRVEGYLCSYCRKKGASRE